MINVRNAVTIQAPIERVFKIVSDPCMDPKWHFDVVEAASTNGSPAPGARYRWTFDYMGQGREEAEVQIVELEPNERYVVYADTGALRQTMAFSLKSQQPGRTICVRELSLEHDDIPPEGEAAWTPRIEGRGARYLESLKRLAEGLPMASDGGLRQGQCACCGG